MKILGILALVCLVGCGESPLAPLSVDPRILHRTDEEGFVPCAMIPVQHEIGNGYIEIIFICPP